MSLQRIFSVIPVERLVIVTVLLMMRVAVFPQASADQHVTPVMANPGNPKTVFFENKSHFLRPGFVREPFLASQNEMNIFVIRRDDNPIRSIQTDEDAELFYSGDTHIPYILKNGDTIIIQDDASNRAPYVLSSRDLIRNNEINYFQQAFRDGIPLLFWEKGNENHGLVKRSILENNPSAIDKIYKSAIEFTDNYFKKFIVTKDFRDFVYTYVKFNHYIKIFTYLSGMPIIDSLKDRHYFDFSFATSNIYASCNLAYHGAIFQYVMSGFKQVDLLKDPGKLFAKADKDLPVEASSIFKFIFLKNNIDRIYARFKEDSANKYIKQVGSRRFEAILVEKKLNYESGILNKNKIIKTNGTVMRFEDILKSYSGARVYIDFWASWCGPCREEFENYSKLKKICESARVKLIFISIDKSPHAWKRAAENEHLESNNSYLFVDPSLDLLKKFNLNSIPRYHLYGRSGRLISNDAPRPSEILKKPDDFNQLLEKGNQVH